MSDRVVAIVGPTATGKSALALDLAEHLGAEIVAIDAFTVYRGMDVGTAKPSPVTRARVPHHMVDVLDPSEECTVAWFQSRARAAIAEVLKRDRLPLLVGGSGLYYRAVVDALVFPPTDVTVRAQIEARHRDDPVAAHALLAADDPEAARRIDPHNLRRTVRALEVLTLTGRPFSAFRTAWERYETILSGLEVHALAMSPSQLAVRIDRRVEAMLDHGLLEECRALADRPLSTTAAAAIGYQEGIAVVTGSLDRAAAAERIAARTRRYAARQRRFLARDPRIRWASAGEIRRRVVGGG